MVRVWKPLDWLLWAGVGLAAVPIVFWGLFHLIFHVPSPALVKPVLVFEALQIVMTPAFYMAWLHYESPAHDLRLIYLVCAVWCTAGVSLLFKDLFLFALLPSTINRQSLYETVWIGVPVACTAAYFLAKNMNVTHDSSR